MNREQKLTAIIELVEPICTALRVELVEARLLPSPGGPLLRLTLDKEGSGIADEGTRAVGSAVTLDDCTRVHRDVVSLLDLRPDLLLTESYRLEVSSPGSERPLTRYKDFIRFSGRPVRVHLHQKRGGRKRFTGELLGIVEGASSQTQPSQKQPCQTSFKVVIEDDEFIFSLDEVERVHLVAS